MVSDHPETELFIPCDQLDRFPDGIFTARNFNDLLIVDNFTVVDKKVAGTFGHFPQQVIHRFLVFGKMDDTVENIVIIRLQRNCYGQQ